VPTKTIRLTADMENLGKLIDFAAAFTREHAVAPAKATDLQVVLEEAFVNICRYAYPGERGEMEASFLYEEGRMIVEIVDSGIPFDMTAQREPDLTADLEARKIGGLGCFLIRKLTDRAEYRREKGRNILRLISMAPREAKSGR